MSKTVFLKPRANNTWHDAFPLTNAINSIVSGKDFVKAAHGWQLRARFRWRSKRARSLKRTSSGDGFAFPTRRPSYYGASCRVWTFDSLGATGWDSQPRRRWACSI